MGETYVTIFKESLQENYPQIGKRIASQNHLNCVCRSADLSYPSGSEENVSELSTTTTIIPEVNTHEKYKDSNKLVVSKTSRNSALKQKQSKNQIHLNCRTDTNQLVVFET